jgi:hypothetical protein
MDDPSSWTPYSPSSHDDASTVLRMCSRRARPRRSCVCEREEGRRRGRPQLGLLGLLGLLGPLERGAHDERRRRRRGFEQRRRPIDRSRSLQAPSRRVDVRCCADVRGEHAAVVRERPPLARGPRRHLDIRGGVAALPGVRANTLTSYWMGASGERSVPCCLRPETQGGRFLCSQAGVRPRVVLRGSRDPSLHEPRPHRRQMRTDAHGRTVCARLVLRRERLPRAREARCDVQRTLRSGPLLPERYVPRRSRRARRTVLPAGSKLRERAPLLGAPRVRGADAGGSRVRWGRRLCIGGVHDRRAGSDRVSVSRPRDAATVIGASKARSRCSVVTATCAR